MCHEVIAKTIFVPFGDILIIFHPFGLIPLSNGVGDAIPNHNSALFYKFLRNLYGFQRFAAWAGFPKGCSWERIHPRSAQLAAGVPLAPLVAWKS